MAATSDTKRLRSRIPVLFFLLAMLGQGASAQAKGDAPASGGSGDSSSSGFGGAGGADSGSASSSGSTSGSGGIGGAVQVDQGGGTTGVGGEGEEHVGTAVQADDSGGCCCYPDLPPGNNCREVAGPDQCGKELGGGQYISGRCGMCSVAGPTIGGSGGGMGDVARMAMVLVVVCAMALRRAYLQK